MYADLNADSLIVMASYSQSTDQRLCSLGFYGALEICILLLLLLLLSHNAIVEKRIYYH